ncbi:hypothetical protein B0T16DRAFT_453422 [Cercophora newfieldiana]|uniref:Uncharacterized protein n=1 Tax=Cercophora newfieldiana TaxID=92897 RepID=A0AA39YU45_9PEZI|nr:hypothetical protein B0T16DRAFT_453422 [Cercophora newfieldiana]
MKGYGLWKGTLKEWDINDARTDPSTPHGHIKFTDDSGRTLDCAINVKSSDVVTEVLKALTERRFYEASSPSDSKLGLRIDLLRDGFIELKEGRISPWNSPGVPNDDIVDFLESFVLDGVAKNAEVYIFGQQYFPVKNGLHQMHMVQGSFFNPQHPNWQKENGVHQDGGIFLHFPEDLVEGCEEEGHRHGSIPEGGGFGGDMGCCKCKGSVLDWLCALSARGWGWHRQQTRGMALAVEGSQ